MLALFIVEEYVSEAIARGISCSEPKSTFDTINALEKRELLTSDVI